MARSGRCLKWGSEIHTFNPIIDLAQNFVQQYTEEAAKETHA